MVEIKYIDVLVMVLKIKTIKKPKKIRVIGFLVRPRSNRWSNW